LRQRHHLGDIALNHRSHFVINLEEAGDDNARQRGAEFWQVCFLGFEARLLNGHHFVELSIRIGVGPS